MSTKTKKTEVEKTEELTAVTKESVKKEVIEKPSIAYGSHKVYLRRRPIGGHLPKEVRAEAVTKLSSIFVNSLIEGSLSFNEGVFRLYIEIESGILGSFVFSSMSSNERAISSLFFCIFNMSPWLSKMNDCV